MIKYPNQVVAVETICPQGPNCLLSSLSQKCANSCLQTYHINCRFWMEKATPVEYDRAKGRKPAYWAVLNSALAWSPASMGVFGLLSWSFHTWANGWLWIFPLSIVEVFGQVHGGTCPLMRLIGQISHDREVEMEQMWSRRSVESSEEETGSSLPLHGCGSSGVSQPWLRRAQQEPGCNAEWNLCL